MLVVKSLEVSILAEPLSSPGCIWKSFVGSPHLVSCGCQLIFPRLGFLPGPWTLCLPPSSVKRGMYQRQAILVSPLVTCHASRGQMASLNMQLAAKSSGHRPLLSNTRRVRCRDQLPSFASSLVLSLYSFVLPASPLFLKNLLQPPPSVSVFIAEDHPSFTVNRSEQNPNL